MLSNRQEITIKELIEIEGNIKIPKFHREFIWDVNRKKLFIDSILKEYPINELYFIQDRKQIYCIDGYQRISTIIAFSRNEFETLEGKEYKNLDSKIQKIFLNYKVNINYLSESQNIEEIYYRLNTSLLLNEDNVLYRSTYTYEIQKLAEHHFFKKHFPKRRQLEGYKVIEQLLTAVFFLIVEKENYDDYKDLSLKSLDIFIDKVIKENIILDKNRVLKVLDYLDIISYTISAIDKRKIYNKLDLIPLFLVIDKIIHKNIQINPVKFSEKLLEIYSNLENEYGELRLKDTKSITNNLRRTEILYEEFTKVASMNF
nr:DUF262 domain-containing protein [Lysinibacillus timonensis]